MPCHSLCDIRTRVCQQTATAPTAPPPWMISRTTPSRRRGSSSTPQSPGSHSLALPAPMSAPSRQWQSCRCAHKVEWTLLSRCLTAFLTSFPHSEGHACIGECAHEALLSLRPCSGLAACGPVAEANLPGACVHCCAHAHIQKTFVFIF